MNSSGLDILIEEKEHDLYNAEEEVRDTEKFTVPPENICLLPPLPSSVSLILQTGVNAATDGNRAADGDLKQVSSSSTTVPTPASSPILGSTVNQSFKNLGNNGKSISSSQILLANSYNIEDDDRGNENTEAGDMAARGTSKNNILKRIKSGIRKISSPLQSNFPLEDSPQPYGKSDLSPCLHDSDGETDEQQQQQQQQAAQAAQAQGFSRKTFTPKHISTFSNTSNSSSVSLSASPFHISRHSPNTSISNTRSLDATSRSGYLLPTSPIITVNEKGNTNMGDKSNGSDYDYGYCNSNDFTGLDFARGSDNLFSIDHLKTKEDQELYLQALKQQFQDEINAFEVTEFHLSNSGWYSDRDLAEIKKKRETTVRFWKENIERLEILIAGNQK
ncbi:hypothetical protein PACTADRAFT_52135 [Pachysolen tannophilus NRRL Y-2460]|uniref:Uncharacterized protein n=1 Tax=Pachysolen tannophilus NRRL Y-2460 TaxID=669874 RepID=A0A1E4TN02_PACTA|nr:hypothetical protein PACTADRAFT_52135 [Pachysolen tannophilus NRRL Y-2460]